MQCAITPPSPPPPQLKYNVDLVCRHIVTHVRAASLASLLPAAGGGPTSSSLLLPLPAGAHPGARLHVLAAPHRHPLV